VTHNVAATVGERRWIGGHLHPYRSAAPCVFALVTGATANIVATTLRSQMTASGAGCKGTTT
jgi:hypothetical protein